MQHVGFIRGGLVTLAVASVAFVVGDALIPQDGDLMAGGTDPKAFTALVTSSNYAWWSLRGLFGVAMESIGTVALMVLLLQTSQARLGILSSVLLLLGDLLGMSLFTLLHDVFPHVGALMEAGVTGPEVLALATVPPYILGGMLLTWIGLALSAVAIWRCGCLPRWSGWLALLGMLMIVAPNMAAQLLANALWGAAYLWMALGLRTGEGARPLAAGA